MKRERKSEEYQKDSLSSLSSDSFSHIQPVLDWVFIDPKFTRCFGCCFQQIGLKLKYCSIVIGSPNDLGFEDKIKMSYISSISPFT